MASQIACPGCSHQLALPDDVAGQRLKCPACALEFAANGTPIPPMEVDPKSNGAAPPAKPEAEPLPHGAYAPTRGPTRKPAGVTIYCIECGTRFSRTEEACPGCGLALEDILDPTPRGRPQRRPMLLQPVSGWLPIFGAILVPVGFLCLAALPVIEHEMRRMRGLREFLMVTSLGLGVLSELAAVICFVIWLYQAWRLVLRGDEEYSPGLMVGLLFVPFFNFYWMFRAIPGLSTAIEEELRYVAPGAGSWRRLARVACIVALIPYGQPVAFCLFVAWMLLANNALQRLMRLHEEMPDRVPDAEPERRRRDVLDV